MQTVQVVVYPVQFILLKVRDCINWLLSAWRGMSTTRHLINMRCFAPTRSARRAMPRSQRTRATRPAATATGQDPPRGTPVKRTAGTQKAERKLYLRPAVIPMKWYEAAAKAIVLSDDPPTTGAASSSNASDQTVQVTRFETGLNLPRINARKPWQKPSIRCTSNCTVLCEDSINKGTRKIVVKEVKRAPFLNKRWSY